MGKFLKKIFHSQLITPRGLRLLDRPSPTDPVQLLLTTSSTE